MRAEHTIKVRIELFPEGSVVVARAKELGVSTSGDNEIAAMEAITEALELFMDTLSDMGTCEEVLTESGYVRRGTEWELSNRLDGWTTDNIVPLEAIRRFACVEI